MFGDGFPVTAVGDADQTIYEWRGASLENFAEFPDHFPGRGRSGGDAPAHPQPALGPADSRDRQRHRRPHRSPGRRIRSGRPVGRPAPARWGTAGSGPPTTRPQWIADYDPRSRGRRDAGWGEIAVIFRKNAQIPLVRSVLAAAGIPVQVVSLGGLLHVPEVTDLWAWLRILGDPADGSALLRVAARRPTSSSVSATSCPLARWVRDQDATGRTSPTTTRSPASRCSRRRLRSTNFEAAGVIEAIDRFRYLYEHLVEDAQGVTLVELCRRILTSLGVWIEVDALDDAAARSARLNLYRFLDLAESWSPLEGRPSLTAFLDYLATLLDESAPEELDLARVADADAVTLITVHRAKGLEWDVVFLPAVVGRHVPGPAAVVRRSILPPAVASLCSSSRRRRRSPSSIPTTTRLARQHCGPATRTRSGGPPTWRRPAPAIDCSSSGAFWYGQKKPKKPSALFDLMADLPDVGRATPRATIPVSARRTVTAEDRSRLPTRISPTGGSRHCGPPIADPGLAGRPDNEPGCVR